MVLIASLDGGGHSVLECAWPLLDVLKVVAAAKDTETNGAASTSLVPASPRRIFWAKTIIELSIKAEKSLRSGRRICRTQPIRKCIKPNVVAKNVSDCSVIARSAQPICPSDAVLDGLKINSGSQAPLGETRRRGLLISVLVVVRSAQVGFGVEDQCCDISNDEKPVLLISFVGSDTCDDLLNHHKASWLGERLAHPRRGGKPEFKQERYPPLDGASCWMFFVLDASLT